MSDQSEDHSKTLSNNLYQAIHGGELEHVRMYIEQGVDLNKLCYSESYGETYPLLLACHRGHEEIIKELLKTGANPNQVSECENLPAMFVAALRRVLTLPMMSCLILHGADVNFKDDYGQTILHYLVRGQFNNTDCNMLSVVKLVIENGASFYASDNDDYTPLHEACRWDNNDVLKLFIDEGADVNYDCEPMLAYAASHCNIDMFDLLLNAGADRCLTFEALVNPCEQNNHAMIARILDNCDVDINMSVEYLDDMTILLYACDYRRTTSMTVRLLLDRGADVRAVSDTKDSALHYAAECCNCNKIIQLLSYNHSLNIKNNDNQTPLSKLIQKLINYYSQSRQRASAHDRQVYDALYQASILAFRILVTAGAKVTADVEHNLNKLHHTHPEAQIPDYKIRSTRSLKELCRFAIRGTISVPVDVSLCKLPIPELLQKYLNFPEFNPLVDKYVNIVSTTTDYTDDYATKYADDYVDDFAFAATSSTDAAVNDNDNDNDDNSDYVDDYDDNYVDDYDDDDDDDDGNADVYQYLYDQL